MEEARDTKKKRSLAVTSSTVLTDDLIVDILSCVPVKSICRFKCVSPSWRNLISHPDNRKRLPQTLTGCFYFGRLDTFVSLAEPPRRTGTPTPSPCGFLPANTGGEVVDCCNGLVLLSNSSDDCSDSDSDSGSGSDSDSGSRSGSEPRASYVVCNPATEKWTTVPRSTHDAVADTTVSASILCFDPAVSAHFHVVELRDREPDEDDVYRDENLLFEGFNIYSSETGAWVFHPHYSYWCPAAHLNRKTIFEDGQLYCITDGDVAPRGRMTFFNGLLHFITHRGGELAAVDMKGQTQRVIPVPRGGDVGLIGHSQGHLLYANMDHRCNTSRLSIHVLGENGGWTLKHGVDTSGLFADADTYLGVAAVHPHGDTVFLFDLLKGRLMAYGMGSKRGHVVCSVDEEPYLWSFVPYVPLYLEMAALENSN